MDYTIIKYPARRAITGRLPVCSAAVLAEGEFARMEDVLKYLGDSSYITADHILHLRTAAEREGQDPERVCRETDHRRTMEGLYIKVEEAACLLIRYHTRPPHLIEGDEIAATVLRLAANGELAPDFTLRGLCLLAQADRLGSVADDNQEFLDRIDLARELIAGEDCMDGPYPFGSPRTQRALFKGGSVWRDQALFDDSWGEVILMCGLPGTGKDAWIRASCPGLPVVSLDDVRLELDVTPTQSQGQVVQAARERARALLRQRQPFVWNATSLTALRTQQVGLFEDYGARVRVVFLETAWDENLRRNAGRRDAVPEDVIDGMLARLEPPERWEAQAVEWLCV